MMLTSLFKYVPDGTFIVGDAAYPLKSFLMVPFRDNGALAAQMRKYNYIHSATRNTIERAFALLKSRFPRMRHMELNNVTHAVNFIITTCVLHNYCILEVGLDLRMDVTQEEDEINNFVCIGSSTVDAQKKRQNIMNDL